MCDSVTDRLKNMLSGKRCALLGLGVSNLPLARILLDLGATLTVYDKKDIAKLGEGARALADSGAEFVCKDDCFESIEGDIIFRSPGIRPDIKGIREALARGARLSSETELFLLMTPASTYCITGSDGKTTSTTLCGKFLDAEAKRSGRGRVYVGGNIGTPLIDKCAEMTDADAAVMELSSFQLMTAHTEDSHMYAAITNISPNHLDWHGEMGEYIEAKKKIVTANTRRLVVNADCIYTADIGRAVLKKGGREVFFFSSESHSYGDIVGERQAGAYALFVKDGKIVISDGESESYALDIDRIKLPGVHNIENYMTAIALTYGAVSLESYGDVADSFGGVEHRLEFVRSFEGVDYYNSSIDSSPTRTAAALSALDGRDITVICGGYDKKIPYEPLADALCRYARAVVLTGATADKIEAALLKNESYDTQRLLVIRADSFEDAVRRAREAAREGGCVLLSPASASFDRFNNFAERGDYFKKLVKEF